MNCPKVSVIVPVYNVENYISKCLDSILAQTYENFEIIAINDGGTDNSGSIIDSYAEKYPDKVKVIHQENKGLGGARNTGIEIATGSYLSFIDSDDCIAPNMLEEMVALAVNNESDIAVCGLRYVTESGDGWDCVDNVPYGKKLDVKSDKFVLTVPPAACNKIYKRELFLENNIRYPSKVWYEDLRTTTKLFSVADGVVFTNQCFYYYLQRAGSIIHNKNLDRNREIIDAVEDVIDFYKQNGFFDDFKEELEYIAVQAIFWDAPARILKAVSRHPLLKEFYNYSFENYPQFLENKYFKQSVAGKGITGKIFLFCLKHRFYKLLHLLLKIKG